MLKNYIDLSGLEYFRDSLLVDDIKSGASDTVHAPSVKSVLDYIDSLKVSKIVEPYGDGLVTEAAVGNYVDTQLELVSESITGIEEALEGKADKSGTIIANKIIVSDANGKVTSSPVSSSKVAHLEDVTGPIQEQLDSKTSLEDFQSHINSINPHNINAFTLGLATVAVTGLYDDLIDKPTIATYEGKESDIVKMMNSVKNPT